MNKAAPAPTSSRWRKLPAWLRLPYEAWVYLSSLALFGIGGLVLSLAAFVLYVLLPRRVGKAVGRRGLTGLFRFFTWYLQLWGLFKLDLAAADELADEEGLIVAPNHISLWDVVFLISRLPNVVCITKTSAMRNPIYGGFARLAGYIPNRSPKTMVKLAAEELEAGAHLLVFPEGTRTVTPPINSSFKGGFALIAKRARASIHTVFLSASAPLLSKGRPFFAFTKLPYHYRIRLGERVDIPPGTDTKTFLSDLREHFVAHLPPDPRRDG